MATSALWSILDGLVDGFTGILEDVADVCDGYAGGTTDRAFVMVGVEEPGGETSQTATLEQSVATMGRARSRDEEGDIVCAAVSWRGGNDDPREQRAELKEITSRIENWLRSAAPNSFAGLPHVTSIGFGSSMQLLTDPAGVDDSGNEYGLVLTLVFRVHYKARI